jgi:RNA polymerase primary sigma factor
MPTKRLKKRDRAASLGMREAERDILDLYLHDVSLSRLLTAEQEIAVARRIQQGDETAIDELVTKNLRFVISVAKKYQNRGVALIDLIGEGNVGLMIAARKFDPDHGVKFISYAVWWIRQSILAAIARQGRSVRVPLNRTADLSRIVRAAESLRQSLKREPTAEEVAREVGLSVDLVQSLAALNSTDLRLDAPHAADGDRATIDRFLVAGPANAGSEGLDQFLAEEIDAALAKLAPRDGRVLKLYFGLDGGREHTLEEIGAIFGITRERVRQLRDRALKRLREGDAGGVLASYAA